MATDLKKMVEEWYADYSHSIYSQAQILKKMASNIKFNSNCIEDLIKEIKANREEIEKLKSRLLEPTFTTKPDHEDIRALKVERDRQ